MISDQLIVDDKDQHAIQEAIDSLSLFVVTDTGSLRIFKQLYPQVDHCRMDQMQLSLLYKVSEAVSILKIAQYIKKGRDEHMDDLRRES